MGSDTGTPKRDFSEPPPGVKVTPIPPPVIPHIASSLPQKRALIEDDHTPAVRSPLNPDSSRSKPQDDTPTMASREKRTKKETLKKREAKGPLAASADGRATPELRGKGSQAEENCPFRVSLIGPYKTIDFDPAQPPIMRPYCEIPGLDGQPIELSEATEQPLNRRGYVYEYAIADPTFPSSHHVRRTETGPFFGAQLSFEDAAGSLYFNENGSIVTGERGFRMARANTAMREGRWYWECKILQGCIKDKEAAGRESHGHVRMGWARREASRDAPVGYDAYSYGLRDIGGQKMHMSRPKEFFPAGEDIQEGDIIGLEICLPPLNLHRKVVQGTYNPAVDTPEDEPTEAEAPNVVRDRTPFRFQNNKLCFEKFEYYPTKELEDLMNPSPMTSSGPSGSGEPPNPNHRIPCLRTLPGSYIKIYKNGLLKGTAFNDLLAFLPPASSTNSRMQEGAREKLDDGTLGYYPAVSVFRGGAAEVNFGPHFWHPPPGYENPGGDVAMADADAAPKEESRVNDKLRPAEERVEEQIAEDVVYDIVDEVYHWITDGAKVIEHAPPPREDSFSKDATMTD